MKATRATAQSATNRPATAPRRRVAGRPDAQVLKQLRVRLLGPLLASTDNPILLSALRRAAAEAESLAWLTSCPLLVLPTLIDEKVREARFYAVRQSSLRDLSRDWLALAE